MSILHISLDEIEYDLREEMECFDDEDIESAEQFIAMVRWARRIGGNVTIRLDRETAYNYERYGFGSAWLEIKSAINRQLRPEFRRLKLSAGALKRSSE